MPPDYLPIFTVGHSSHPWVDFLRLLQRHSVQVVCDVRSMPFSRANPHFNKPNIKKLLNEAKISYGFFGNELGGRTNDPNCYVNDKVQYDRLSAKPEFRKAIDRIRRGSLDFRIALMCSEREPLDCHRTVLVARHLAEVGSNVLHIHANGTTEDHGAVLDRLIKILRLNETTFLKHRADVVATAYKIRGQQIAYMLPTSDKSLSQIPMRDLE